VGAVRLARRWNIVGGCGVVGKWGNGSRHFEWASRKGTMLNVLGWDVHFVPHLFQAFQAFKALSGFPAGFPKI
jgi:hypothetical protein